MKKFISIILSLVLVLSLATVASAATITITPPAVDTGATETGITYTAYKIFDATISGSAVAYTIESTSPYYSTIAAATDYFDLTPAAGSTTTYVVTAKAAFDDDAANTFADTLKTVSATAAGTGVKNANGKYVISGLADGYYLVTSSVGSDLILETLGDVTVETKNAYPSLDKLVEGVKTTTADMGQVLTFTIDVTIPEDAVGEIVVHDDMTGVDYQSMTAVDGITADTSIQDGCEVHFTLSANYVAANKNKTITITYTAKVTADIAHNDAWLVDDTYTSTKASTDIYSTDIVIDKVDKANSETKLAGAEFVLKNAAGKFYAVDSNGNVSWVDAQANATTVTTSSTGAAKFENVANGTYYLVETKAPAGYNLLTQPVAVTVTAATNTVDGVTTVVDITATVENSTGSELPSTGGIGTTIFYVVGCLLMTGAVVLLVTKRRMGNA